MLGALTFAGNQVAWVATTTLPSCLSNFVVSMHVNTSQKHRSFHDICFAQASLSVAVGQRAPNRAGVVEDPSQRHSRRDSPAQDAGAHPHRPAPDRRDAEYSRDGVRRREPDSRDRDMGAPRESVRDRYGPADRPRDRYDQNGRDRDRGGWGGGRGGVRDDRGRNGHDRGGDRDRERDIRQDGGSRYGGAPRGRGPPASSVFGRSAADVFGNGGGSAVPSTKAESLESDFAPLKPAKGAVIIGRRR